MKQSYSYSNDSELVSGIRSGEAEAFRLLVEKYQDKIKRTSKGFVHSDADAEDITQDVLIEVYQSIDKFKGESELSTWIYRIAVNKSLNFLKSSFKRKIVSLFELTDSEKETHSGGHDTNSGSDPDNDIIRSEQADAVKKAIDSLPDNQRTAFVLSRYEELPNKEIASVMITSVPAVESLLFRAKQNLQKKLLQFYKKNMQ